MSLRVASCQLIASEYGARSMATYLQQADEQAVDIICFPEGYLNGYTYDATEAHQRALELDSATFKDILSSWKNYKATIIVGIIEKQGDTLFNSAAVIRGGKLLGVYRKTHPNESIYTPGTEYPVFDTKGVTFGITICADANFSEPAQKLASQGAKVIFYPLNNVLRAATANVWRHKHLENLIARSRESRTWAISADVIADSNGNIGYGCSAIVNPNGTAISRVPELTTGLIVHQID